ncbi:MAG: hypothetical protein JWM90_2445 [Thermoleophilia bacterium]|nr:hypothetical protein [Thermoleophilia bacterium]
MQIAPVLKEPKGWSPGTVAPAPSTRPQGLVQGAFAAWRGVQETALGAALTQVQVDTLTPFLAAQFRLPETTVRKDLSSTRVQVGGVAHGAGNVATTIGHDIYVSDAGWATRILSWEGRKWLAHELAHTMQWRRRGDAAGAQGGAERDRAFLNQYVGGFASYDGKVSAGGFVQAATELLRRRRTGEEPLGFGTLLHDTHPMEREADAAMRAAFG